MLVDTREQKPEETKEKPEMQRFSKTSAASKPSYTATRMEDIKEQDSEAEIANSGIYQSAIKGSAKASVVAPKPN